MGLESERENCWQKQRAETEGNGSVVNKEEGARSQGMQMASGSSTGEEQTLLEPPEGAGPASTLIAGRLTPRTVR